MHVLPDITGDNAAHQLSVVNGANATAEWIQVIVAGAGIARMGDSTTSSSVGLALPAGTGMMLPFRGIMAFYTLASVYVYVPVGATVSVAYGS